MYDDFHFMMNFPPAGRQDDLPSIRKHQRVGRLREEKGRGRHLISQLLGVQPVISANAKNISTAIHFISLFQAFILLQIYRFIIAKNGSFW
jgi:hypothetical protein